MTKLLALPVVAVALAGCSLFESEGIDRTFFLPVVALDVPETAAVGQPFTVGITAQITNECITFVSVEANREGDQLTVGAVGRERVRPGDGCTVSISNLDTSVQYVPQQAGELLVVAQGYNGTIQATVQVE